MALAGNRLQKVSKTMRRKVRACVLLGVLSSFAPCAFGNDSTDKEAVQIGPGAAIADRPESDAKPIISRIEYEPVLLGNIENKYLREASGLALSTQSEGIAWAHNDSGNGPYLYAFTLTGEHRGRFYLSGARSSDWEDMEAFRYENQSWLLVADTGDNQSKKPFYTLYLAAEPELPEARRSGQRPLRDYKQARFVYPTGPADTEAVAVDEIEQRIYLITKRRRPALVFSLPLSIFSGEDVVHTARFETRLYTLPAPTLQNLVEHPKFGLAFAQPNAMDFAPDRSFAMVHTYGYSYLFKRQENQTWAQAFATAPNQIDVPSMQQAEAVAIGNDSLSLYYTSEGKTPPLYRLLPKSAVPQEQKEPPQ